MHKKAYTCLVIPQMYSVLKPTYCISQRKPTNVYRKDYQRYNLPYNKEK